MYLSTAKKNFQKPSTKITQKVSIIKSGQIPTKSGNKTNSFASMPNKKIKDEIIGWWISDSSTTSTDVGSVQQEINEANILEEVSVDWNTEPRKIERQLNKNNPVTQIAAKPKENLSEKLPSVDLRNYIEVSDNWDVSNSSIVNRDSPTAGFTNSNPIRIKTPGSSGRPPSPATSSLTQNASKVLVHRAIEKKQLGSRRLLAHKVTINGKFEPSLHAYESETKYLLFELKVIADLLLDSISLDQVNNKVKYYRSRDGARFELNTVSGEVIANGRNVGFLKEVSLIDLELGLFPSNAIQVFSGLLLNRDDEQLVIEMKLDRRLQYITGFDLHVNGRKLPFVTPEPQSLGHVLLLPLEVLVDELGSKLDVSGNTITVTRIQDGAEISLNLNTGLVRTNGNPVGIAPNIAYADSSQLLLPREAIAALTGTYVTILPGSRRIDVDLDGDLARIIHPGDSIQSRTAKSPAKVESVKFFYDSENRMSTVVKGHQREYNLRFEYETPSTQGEDGFTPDWLQLSAESVDGWILSAGDLSSNKRELNGVNVSRISGVSYYRPMKDGILLGVLGKPQSGVEILDNKHQVAIFEGLASGVRYYNNRGDFELGIAARQNNRFDYRAFVVSANKAMESPDFMLGDLSQRTDAALGVYDIEDDTSFGGRLSWDGRLEPTKKISFFARSDYHSSEALTGFDKDKQITHDNKIADSLSLGVGSSYRPLQRLSFAFNHNRIQRGVLEGEVIDDIFKWQKSSGVSTSFNPLESVWSPWIHLSWTKSNTSENEDVRRLSGQAAWKVDAYNLLLRHIDRKSRKRGDSWLSSLELTRDPWIKYFHKNSNLKFAPRFSAWKGDESTSAVLGALLNFDSGKLLGNQTKLVLAYGKNLAVQQIEIPDDTDESSTTDDDYFSANLIYRFNNILRLNSNYHSTLDGRDEVYTSLSAYYEFNPPRRIKKTRSNAGILMGQVFLDENYDGIQQKNEKGLGGARVGIVGTRVALNSDSNGYFTIQNLPVGVYRISPDTSRMPLGYVGRKQALQAVKIDDARITELKIPVVKGNQLSGVVYVDSNNNGTLDRNDERVENIGLELEAGQETASTVFGQFTFDFLPPGKYKLKVQEDTLPDGYAIDSTAKLQVMIKSGERNKFLVKLRKNRL